MSTFGEYFRVTTYAHALTHLPFHFRPGISLEG